MSANARGFTLIEVLVAMAVFALVALMASGLASSALSARGELDAADERLRRLQTARALIKADIGQIVWRPARDAFGGAGRGGFVGGIMNDGEPLLAFVRGGWTNTGAEARPSLQYVEYAVVGDALVRRTRAALDPTPNTPVEEMSLLQPVSGVEVSFLTGETWQPRWRVGQVQGAALPDAVALDLTLQGLGPVRQVFATP
jgi:general secretion pathway protein J